MQFKRRLLFGIVGCLFMSAVSFAANEQDCMRAFNNAPPQVNLDYFVSQLGPGEVVAQANTYLWRRGEYTLSMGEIGETRGVKIYPQGGQAPEELIAAVQMRARKASIEEIEAFLGEPSQKMMLRKMRWLCEDAQGDQFEHYVLVDENDRVFDHFSFVMPVD